MSTQVITVAIIKGGTGKTITAAALAQAAAATGKRVLCIDMDPQCNLTAAIGADRSHAGSYELLHGEPAANVIQTTQQGIDMIAASENLAAEKTRPGSAKRLQAALGPIKEDYDLVIIDTPPTMGELTYNALQASTGLLIPLEADINSVRGLYNVADIAQQIGKTNADLSIIGVLVTRYDGRPRINKMLTDTIKEKAAAANVPYLGEVRAGIAIREAQALRQSLFEYAPNSKPAQDYKRIYEKIMEV